MPSPQTCAAYSNTLRDRNIAVRSDYDVLGRVTATTQNYVDGTYSASARDEDIQTRTTYDGLGRALTVTRNYVNGVYSDSAPDEDVLTRYGYDGLGRTLAVTTTVSSSQSAITRTSYDLLGRAVATTDPQGRVTQQGYDGSGAQRWLRSPDGRVSVLLVDGLGRVVASIQNYQNGTLDGDPADRDLVTRTVYDLAGRRIRTIDPAGRTTAFAYDNMDRLIGVTENMGTGCAAPCSVATQYAYDRMGNRIKLIDPLNHIRTFRYNAAGEQTTAIDGLGTTSSWQYDALGRVVKQLDPRDRAGPPFDDDLTYSYDGLDRLAGTTAGSATALSPITAQYDALGRRLSLADGSGTTSFSYDALGRMGSATAPNTGLVSSSYNGRGDRTKLVYPDATTLNYSYFNDGQLQQVTQGTTSPATLATYTYDPVGRPAQVARANGAVTNYGYDQADRLRAVRTLDAGAVESRFQYQTDRLGLRTVVTETLPLTPTLIPTRIRTITFEGASLLDPVSGGDSINGTVLLTSTTPLKEFYSAVVPNTGDSYVRANLSATDELFVTFYLRVTALPGSSGRVVMISNSGTTVGNIQLSSSGKLRLRNGSTQIGLDSATLTLGALYRVGLHQKKGSGANAILEGYLASGDAPFTSAFAASTSEIFTTQADRVQIGTTNSNAAGLLLDDIALDTAALAPPSLLAARGAAGESGRAALAPRGGELDIPQPDPADSAAIRQGAFGQLPLTFIPNAGQTDAAVRFMLRGMGGTLLFTPGELAMALRPPTRRIRPEQLTPPRERDWRLPRAVLRQRYLGVSPTATMTGTLRLPGRANFLTGSDPSTWRTDLPTYADMVERQLYAGIDLYYSGLDGQLKTTYVVAPGADPTRIRWRYTGAQDLRVDADGNLVITLPAPASDLTDTQILSSTLIEQAPLAWQTINERDVMVAVRYVVASDGSVGLAFGAYDPTQRLTIDPTLTYSTYLGGSGVDTGNAIAIDPVGNAYVTGQTASLNFPTVIPGGARLGIDVFVAKLNPSGSTLVYTTFLGGSGNETGNGIAVDTTGNAFVVGETTSTNFPLLSPRQATYGGAPDDAFVTKLSPSGGLVYSTYLGGNANDLGTAIAIDSSGAAYVTGYTTSSNFPTQTPLQSTIGGLFDAFLTKLVWNGSTLSYGYSTFLGGSSSDYGYAIAVDSSGKATATGETDSTNFPTHNPRQASRNGTTDAFVAQTTASGSALSYSTYLGGSSDEVGIGVVLDSGGNVYLTGQTYSTDFPTLSPAQAANGGSSDAFVTKLNPANPPATQLVFSTYLGGNAGEYGAALALASTGTLYVTGITIATNFPTLAPLQASAGGMGDAFVTQLTASGSGLLFSSYLGGSNVDRGAGIRLDAAGNVYLAGTTDSTNFPLAGPRQGSNGGGSDAFVTKIGMPTSPPATRVISYTYDGLLRLIGAAESPGVSYGYTYDLAGNRIDATVNGIAVEPHRTYNAANQVTTAGYSYDLAGSLLSDGVSTYSYDALNRTRSVAGLGQTRSYTYNGDGAMVLQRYNTSWVTVTQDLAAPLSQILQTKQDSAATLNYLYGQERLVLPNGAGRAWPLTDGLGSVRRTLDDSGAVVGSSSYDPWGNVESGAVPTFRFTGELQDPLTGLVNLRARWYSTARGTFTSRDPFEGDPEQPYSQHPYQYGLSDPVLNTDPTGRCSAPGQGDDYCHTENSGSYDPYGYAKILCIGKGGDWDEQSHICRERLRPPPPNNEQPPLPAPFTTNEPEKDRDILGGEAAPMLNPPAPRNPPFPRPRVGPGVLVGGALLLCLYAALNALPHVGPIATSQPAPTSQPEQYLYHYTLVKNIPNITKEGLWASEADPSDPKSDAQWGDGQYFTDLTPEESATVTRGQHSYALFTTRFHWGPFGREWPDVGWIKIKVNGLPVRRVASVFGPRFPHRSIYLLDNKTTLSLTDRIEATGTVIFQLSPSGNR